MAAPCANVRVLILLAIAFTVASVPAAMARPVHKGKDPIHNDGPPAPGHTAKSLKSEVPSGENPVHNGSPSPPHEISYPVKSELPSGKNPVHNGSPSPPHEISYPVKSDVPSGENPVPNLYPPPSYLSTPIGITLIRVRAPPPPTGNTFVHEAMPPSHHS
ncbi:pollen-specific leucine-rich repeat extensin-like protein 3 [Brachypodium distachyon]|uniref:pollen-specific leucine-rich repeat extensin-like protein 3 n=1 Tax=Brachypodium distachyon TaxID=15368 RepID=UPI00052FDD9D|nr:pollen-specific leucine-rich repeat extensin-like protein 3 [Brachypodium distachyon]|eukprot:XP_010239241.1 pollen-specific leucine-rich repeat extensin-like protein 3 [Brachypodium distachyon]